ncbi:MAG: ribonuclease P protein component [Pseudomonadota bacterium]
MTPPEAPRDRATATPEDAPAVSRLERLRKRADFLAAARGRRATTPGFVLQARQRPDTATVRVGFTCSKKVGNAVARNRAKRRLREAARLTLPDHGTRGWDYVLIGRKTDTAKRPFEALCKDLEKALKKVHGEP